MPNRVGRVVLTTVAVLLGLAALAGIAVFVVTNTDWGRERVRRQLLSILRNRVHGQATIGRVTGNLLTGVTAHDVAIRDSAGRPFVVADQVSGKYRVLSLLRRRLWFDDVRLVRPLVVLDKPPAGTWNWKHIFPKDTTPSTGGPSWTDWVQFTDVTVVDGRVIVRSPWKPDEELTRAQQDSSARDALAGGTRLLVVRAPGGYQKVVELRNVNATAPLVRLADPRYEVRLARVSSLRMTALPFRPPAADVRDMRGAFEFTGDSLWWKNMYAELPGSRVSGNGRYDFEDGDMTLTLRGAPASLADFRWVYPRLPSEGRGTLDFAMIWEGTTDTYIARNADIRIGRASLAGDFGITFSDTVAIHDTDLRVANLDTRLVEQLVPRFDSPRRGTISGHVQARGGKNALLVNGDLAFSDARSGTSRVVANGEVGFGHGLRARNLRLRLDPFQVELARAFLGDAPISGVVRGNVVLDGNTDTRLAVRGDVRHVDRGAVSALSGRGTIRLAGTRWMDLDVVAQPLSLVEVGRFAPSLGLRGWVSGPIRATGTPENLRIAADLRLPQGGSLDARGTVRLAGRRSSYDIATAMRVVNLETVMAKAPPTSLTARATARGRGLDPATMTARIAADFATSSWDSVAIDSGTVRAGIANGLLDVQRLRVSGASTLVVANGSFGLAPGRQGELAYRVLVDSLGAYNRWLPRTSADTGAVAPRPGRVLRAVERARADSLRVARATEVQRALTGALPQRLVVDTPATVRRDSLAGSLYAAGRIRGNVRRFDLRGRVTGRDVVAYGNTIDAFRGEYAWTNARTPQSTLALGLQADTVSVAGFGFDSVDARVGYRLGGRDGRIEVVVRQGDDRDYALRGDFAIDQGGRELRITSMALRFDTTAWTATRPALVHWHRRGLEVHTLELRSGALGRIYVNGLLPTEGAADLEVAIDHLPVDDVAGLLQSDLDLHGIVSLSGRVRGTMRSPTFQGAFGVVNGTYRGTTLPELHGTFAYANQRLTTRVDAIREGGAPMAVAQGTIPINLALSGVSGRRLLDQGMALNIDADSLPLELIPYFTDAVSGVSGLAVGRIALRGTLRRPTIIGALTIARGTVTLASTGMRVSDITGSVRMLSDSIHIDSIVGRAYGPIRLRGHLEVGSWREPGFDLYLTGSDAEVLRNNRGRLRADLGLALTGPFREPYLSGQVTVTQGVVYAPDPSGKRVINAGDPALFAVVDTALTENRELFPVTSPFMQNLRMEVAVAVRRDTWVRSKDMNIEMYTEFPVFIRSYRGNMSLVGTITTDRGEYSFLSKRFQISRGSATFIGGPEINPTLQVTGEYQVQLTGAPALNIRVLIGGTLKRPRLTLESDAQPPRSQSELLTMLAFGRSSSNLLQVEGSAITGGVGAGDLVGIGANIAVRRLAGIAMGVAIQEVETEAGRGIGADVFDITPADVPESIEGGHTIGTFFRETRLEVGKYLNPRTFLGLQGQGQAGLGVRVQHRDSRGWIYQTYWEPRLLLKEPSLAGQGTARTTAIGALIAREWRF